LLAAAELFFVGVPFSDVSFRAFTASPTVEKGTPTAQRFDNRSIASLLSDSEICSSGSFQAGTKEHSKSLRFKVLQERPVATGVVTERDCEFSHSFE